ncbi:anthranilate synthase component I family protein [Veillonella sp. YH-vei2232]|jgi:anthranilate synthase component 1|uniref:Anthranilate synthase component 1 n=1 Tax=Veillonella absiana TaxID=3079305 RepID=A0ABU3Z8S8_9FIRM|nr:MULTISPECIES: anthranilate synthase component I family protein [unclassified Veillonella]NCB95473.1 anthranilate synthase component I family protein [Negativicutes bacterium]MBP6923202.1 anthranilate synthase component I family protein [Veillonella sp.]MBP9517080.1 anthranilate synthase component I family protein [Veillonella sp.]MBP9551009.1 anthranilate synthase component I family protein [Veillonella sp.]MDV5062647.1 anthranilate synthase component I family protein [Veillonella sp. YH-ve
MIKPSVQELQALGQGYTIVPVYKEILSDVRTPISVLKALKKVSSHTYLLESADNSHHWGRYSFLGYDSKLEVFCKNHQMTIKGATTQTFPCDNPAAEIRKILAQYKSPKVAELPTFTGGFVGYFAYEYIRYIEPVLDFPVSDDDESTVNDVDLMLFDKVIAFDHFKNTIYLIANIGTDDLERNYNKAQIELDALAELVVKGEEADIPPCKLTSEFTSEFTMEEYEDVVRTTQHYIKEGDIFQAVVSNRREAKMEGSLLNAYRVLRTMNPSPYMFYLSGHDVELTGASPETLVKLTDNTLYTFPIAGTMPRGKNEAEDRAMEEKLINDEKELAEHNMLVDLGRNDLGKISEFGSVNVDALHMLQRFSHVIHITSTVSGTIRPEYDALDAIGATLPAGTLSGAPKIRAIQILHDLEKSPRGVYGGAVGYIDFSGNMDVCIGIRMAMAKAGRVFVRSGGGIVRDSVPQNEYKETIYKAQSMVTAITAAQEVE